jgi:glycosyltransferase involved in cell wall biosynthesis
VLGDLVSLSVAIDAAALGSKIGGDETFVRGVLDGLGRRAGADLEIHVYAPEGAPVPLRDAPVRSLPPRRGIVHFAVDLPLALWADRRSLDLVMSVTHAPLTSPVPRVLVVGDLSFEHLPHAYPAATRLRLRHLVRRQARSCRMVVTPSEFSRTDLIERYGLAPERVSVVPNRVVPAGPLDPALDARAAARGVRPPFILYVGNLHPRKNLRRLVHAFARARSTSTAVADHQLVIAGARWWGDAETDGDDSVLALGRVDDDLRDHLMARATLLAYPSLFEGFGLPALEAMAVGTPVLTSAATSLPEVCGDAAVLVDPYDTDAIAHGLVSLCEDDALRSDLAVKGRHRAATYGADRTGDAAIAALRAAAALGDQPMAKTGLT